jgi:hypothetical protein
MTFPRVLEIGVDKGQTLFPLVNYLTKVVSMSDTFPEKFYYEGIDVYFRPDVNIMINSINDDIWGSRDPLKDPPPDHKVVGLICSHEKTSHDALTSIIANGAIKEFDLILIDGDHNYETVSRELKFALDLLSPHGIIICDDYCGEGGLQDEFFSQADDFYAEAAHVDEIKERLLKPEGVKDKTKQGVKTAVDEFLEENKCDDWALHKPTYPDEPTHPPVDIYSGAPVILYRKGGIIEFVHKRTGA